MDIPNAARWPERPLGDICELISRGAAPVYVEHSDVKAIGQRCVASSGFDASKARPHSGQAMANVLRPAAGDVLLNSTGTGTIGRSCVFDSPGSFVVDGHVTALRPSPRSLDGRWLDALLRSAWGQTHLERYCFSSSTNQVELNRLPLTGTRVPVPPLDEQRIGAEILDTLDTALRQTEAIIDKLKQIKQGLLHDLLTRGIDANGELRPPQSQSPHLYKDSPLGWMPREWTIEALGELASSSVIGPFGSDLVADDYRSEGVPVVFVRDVKANCFAWKSNVYLSLTKAAALVAHEVRGGDVLLTKMGFPPCVAAVYPQDLPPGVVTADIVRVRFESGRVSPAWVSLSINEAAVMKQVEQITAGATRPKVTLRDVRNLLIRQPPIVEQDRVLIRMASLDHRIDFEIGTTRKLARQKSGLMDDLLTGRVRVTPLLAAAAP